jgi:hypothetical protein
VPLIALVTQEGLSIGSTALQHLNEQQLNGLPQSPLPQQMHHKKSTKLETVEKVCYGASTNARSSVDFLTHSCFNQINNRFSTNVIMQKSVKARLRRGVCTGHHL